MTSDARVTLTWFVIHLLPVIASASPLSHPAKQTYFQNYYMLEELPPRSLVGNLVRDYGLVHKYEPEVLARLRFTMLTQSQLERPNFVVDELTGDIHMASRRLDRESICPRQDECIVQFDVAVQPIQYFQIIKVTLICVLPVRASCVDFVEVVTNCSERYHASRKCVMHAWITHFKGIYCLKPKNLNLKHLWQCHAKRRDLQTKYRKDVISNKRTKQEDA